MELQVALDERPHVVAVAPGVVGQEGERVHASARQVVEGPDQALPLAALPGRVAGPPVADVGRPGLERHLRIRGHGAVEVGVAEERLRRVGAGLEEVRAAAGEAQVVAADVLQPALGPEVATLLVGGEDGEGPRGPVHAGHRLDRRLRVDGGARSLHERRAPGPAAGLVRREVRAPLRAFLRRGLARVAVGGEVAGHVVDGGARLVLEPDGEAVVEEGVGPGVALPRERAVEGQRDLVPLLQLAGDRAGRPGRGRRHGRGGKGGGQDEGGEQAGHGRGSSGWIERRMRRAVRG